MYGECKIGDKTYQVGEKWKEESKCVGHTCLQDGTYSTIPCGLMGIPPGWVETPVDNSKPFPECCTRVNPPVDIVPDVLDELRWTDILEVTYDDDLKVDSGNELTPTQVKVQPKVNYTADAEAYYLLCMTDPDAPSRKNPTSREFLHWLVGNIPGNDISAGEVLAQYVGSGPPQGTGLHRYVFLVYKQPRKLDFDEPRISNTSREHRGKFSIRKLAQKYNLKDPIVNVYQAQYDDYVPVLHKQLGIKI